MIDFKHKSPGFKAEGPEPPESLKSEGFQEGYKPPAGFFNWFWTLVSNCITEIQTILKGMAKDDLSNVDDAVFLDKAVNAGAGGVPIANAISTDGVAYTATVEGVTELKNGLLVTIIPNMNSASKSVTIDINGLGAKMIRIPLSFNTAAMDRPKLETFFVEGRPTMIQFDANYIAGGLWKTVEKQKTSAQDLYGTVPVDSGGTGAANSADALKNLGLTATAEELNYMDGVTENVQDQINRISTDIGNVAAEALHVTGAASTVVVNNLSGNRALVSDGNGKIAVSPVTSTELGYLDGVTGNVQTQINGKSANGHKHTKSEITDFPSSMPASDVPAWAKAASKPTYTASEVGAAASSHKHSASDITSGTLPPERGGTGATDAATARKNLSVPYYAEYSGGKMQMGAGSASAWVTFNADDGTSNQMDLTKTATQFSKPVNIASGGTGATTKKAARKALGAEIQCGVADNVGSSGAQITFPEAFSGVPVVTATGGSEVTSVYVRDITTTGFRLISGVGNNDGVQWQAIYISN